MFATKRYPEAPLEVARLYGTSAKLVRYLFKKYPHELFPKFVALVTTAGHRPKRYLKSTARNFPIWPNSKMILVALLVRGK
ncbi:MAG: hypothetical protein H0W66_13325 [Chthoniobacterales bacterium]|nr:hypothetical protein [Chthoniobacterales bacterium]